MFFLFYGNTITRAGFLPSLLSSFLHLLSTSFFDLPCFLPFFLPRALKSIPHGREGRGGERERRRRVMYCLLLRQE
jgi:hypothetical protein